MVHEQKPVPTCQKNSLNRNRGAHLAFLSQAGFAAGTARGPSFQILENMLDQLAASFFDGSSVNAFVLNKKNGLVSRNLNYTREYTDAWSRLSQTRTRTCPNA